MKEIKIGGGLNVGIDGEVVKYTLNDILYIWNRKERIDKLYYNLRLLRSRDSADKNHLSLKEFFEKNKIDLHLITIFKDLEILDDDGNWKQEYISFSMAVEAQLMLLNYYRKVKGTNIN